MRRMSGSAGIVELQRQMIVQLHSCAGEREEVSVSLASFDDTVASARRPRQCYRGITRRRLQS